MKRDCFDPDCLITVKYQYIWFVSSKNDLIRSYNSFPIFAFWRLFIENATLNIDDFFPFHSQPFPVVTPSTSLYPGNLSEG